jgi:hypothetical protein
MEHNMTFFGTTVNKVATEGSLDELSDKIQKKIERKVHVLEILYFQFVLVNLLLIFIANVF